LLEIECEVFISGDFRLSCVNIIAEEYNSADENAPSICKVTADCPTMFSGLPFKRNEVYLPAENLHIGNKNGTLTFLERDVSYDREIDKIDYECSPLRGSHKETCSVQNLKYHTTDANLLYTELCIANFVCQKLDTMHATASKVYFNIFNQESVDKKLIENCDGDLVIGTSDYQCNYKAKVDIEEIKKQKGQKGDIKI
jgi:hypothetical protein